jgi:CheY-like chemotaxis protein
MMQILLVEDNDMNRDMLVRYLRWEGYEVQVGVNGAKAVDLAIQRQPQLILMDLGLPVMDGWEATRRIKSNPSTNHIPIIALTAHALSGDREDALSVGCDDYETKPVTFQTLIANIKRFLAA